MEQIQIDAWMFVTISSFIGLLLAIVAVFLRRLLGQFDALTAQVSKLGETLIRIDKDLSGDVSILMERDKANQKRLMELDPVWDRLRDAENRIVALESGCEAFRCKT